jgi:hypothetical protein
MRTWKQWAQREIKGNIVSPSFLECCWIRMMTTADDTHLLLRRCWARNRWIDYSTHDKYQMVYCSFVWWLNSRASRICITAAVFTSMTQAHAGRPYQYLHQWHTLMQEHHANRHQGRVLCAAQHLRKFNSTNSSEVEVSAQTISIPWVWGLRIAWWSARTDCSLRNQPEHMPEIGMDAGTAGGALDSL